MLSGGGRLTGDSSCLDAFRLLMEVIKDTIQFK